MAISNEWVALYDTSSTPALIGQSTSVTTAWAANTLKKFDLATPYVVPATGLYYAALSVKAGTPPNLISNVQLNLITSSSALQTGAKMRSQTWGTTPGGTAPSTIASGTARADVPWVGVF